MQYIYAPWRSGYIGGPKAKGCIFCEKTAQNDDPATLILHRGKLCFVIMNIYPYNPGHVMVVPFRHVGKVTELSDEESSECFGLVRDSVAVIERGMQPHGFNVGMNLGQVSGAGIVDHVHVHVVPRWNGDTNFMPVVGQTKVMSAPLGETYGVLKPLYDRLAAR